MVPPEKTNWLFDYGFVEDISIPDGNFAALASGFTWHPFNANVEINESLRDESKKRRVKSETWNASSIKACREKLRRDRLNDKFMELASLLEPGKLPKTDKAAILLDATRLITHLRTEHHKLKEVNWSLEERITELKAEKNELRDENQRLKAELERLEQKLKTANAQPSCFPPAPFAAQGQTTGNKIVPVIGYPGVAMWQFLPPATVDTSQDHVLHPPVA